MITRAATRGRGAAAATRTADRATTTTTGATERGSRADRRAGRGEGVARRGAPTASPDTRGLGRGRAIARGSTRSGTTEVAKANRTGSVSTPGTMTQLLLTPRLQIRRSRSTKTNGPTRARAIGSSCRESPAGSGTK
jgi:hypothetical protein